MRQDPIDISVVLPVYNEEVTLKRTIDTVSAHLGSLELDSEIIVVDNLSDDRTLDVAVECARRDRSIVVLHNSHKHGKGWAVRTGMMHARGRMRFFMDADLSTPVGEMSSLIEELEKGADVAIGSRRLEGSAILKAQPWIRVAAGQVYNLLVRLLFYPSCRDSQCGFKAFTARAAEALFPLQKVTGFGFDIELLHLARKRGLAVAQVPVRWRDERESRVSLLRDVPSMLRDLARVRIASWLGRYQRRTAPPRPMDLTPIEGPASPDRSDSTEASP